MILGILAVVPPAWTQAQVEVPCGPVVEATVYLSGAEVVLEAMAKVPRGASTVTVLDFPAGVDSSEVQVSSGDPQVRIDSLTFGSQPVEAGAEVAELDRQILALADRLFELERTEQNASALRSFLDSAAQAGIGKGLAKEPTMDLDAAKIDALYGLVDSRFRDLLAAQMARRAEQRELDKRLAELRQKRQDAQETGSVRVAMLQVQAERAGEVPLRFRYVVERAGWSPRYRATLHDDGEVELVAEASVVQFTGDDWTDVELRLSTVTPSSRLDPPYLGTWSVDLRTPPPQAPADGRDPWAKLQTVPGVQMDRINVGGNESGQQSMYVSPPETPGRVEPEQVEATRSRYSVTYDAVGRPTLPGDGEPRRVEIWRSRLPATLSYRVKPSLTTDAYLEATVRVPDDRPLLEGTTQFYTGGSRLGESGLPEKPPGADLILPFGIDQRVQVKRRTLDETYGRAAFKNDEANFHYRTTVTNYSDEPIEVVLEDRIPVSDDERLQVIQGSETTPGAEPSKTRRGVWLWHLKLQPSQSGDVELAFRVKYPREMQVNGLD